MLCEIAKLFLFYCNTLPAPFLIEQKKHKKLTISDNIVLCIICKLLNNDIQFSKYNVLAHESTLS